ncbi:hypothetical protein L1987_25389 [Smallanthus sonchifolius]|uniref:Uncharacterized protein n=1 Tax=Smallanthus sonchifolius TaxID=185202 RepID=A0ACB9INN1_9ASTR|nr:hypothetical protein L1987_25389 [Smallanthus sonchifolius]
MVMNIKPVAGIHGDKRNRLCKSENRALTVDQDFSCPITPLGYPFRLYIHTAQLFLANPYLSQFSNHVLRFRSSNLDPQIHVINQLHQSNHVLFPPLNLCFEEHRTMPSVLSLEFIIPPLATSFYVGRSYSHRLKRHLEKGDRRAWEKFGQHRSDLARLVPD